MAVLRLPLVGVHNQRSIDGSNAIILGEDQRFINCTFDAVKNPVTGKTIFYLEKRPGWNVNSLVSAGNISTGLIKTDIMGTIVSAFGVTTSTIFDTQTSVGTITGEAIHFSETSLSGTGFVMIRSSDGTGWYYASDSKAQLTYTGTTTAGNVQIDAITAGTGTAGTYSGQLITGANIGAASRISTVLSTTQLILTVAATGGGSAAFTKEPIAKILSANFITTGTNLSAFVEMDGYQFYVSEDGNVYNSDLNTVHLYTASNKIAANMSPDLPVAIGRHKNLIICFGTNSTEFFFNAGNAAGSPLSRAEQYYQRVGIQNQRSLVTLEDVLYFVSSSRNGDIQVKKMENLTISKISTPAVDRILGTGNATGSAIYLSAFTLGGYPYLLLQVLSVISVVTTTSLLLQESADFLLIETGFKFIIEEDSAVATAETIELVYNISLNIWSEWDSPLLTFVKGIGAGSTNQLIASSRLNTGGKIYGINPASDTEVYADDGVPYTLEMQTSAPDLGTDKRKFIRSITLIGDQQASGTALLEKSDDDYQTWQTLGTFDLTAKEQKITRCGSHKGERAYRLTHTLNSAFRAQALEIQYDVGLA